MLTVLPDDLHTVDLRLISHPNQLTTTVVDHTGPRRIGPAGRSALVTGGGRHSHQIEAGTLAAERGRERERLAVAVLVDELGRDPGLLLLRLVEVVTGVLGFGSAAVVMSEGDPLRWDAAAGPLADSPRWTAFHCAVVAQRLAGRHRQLSGDTTVPKTAARSAVQLDDARAIPLLHKGATAGVLWVANRGGTTGTLASGDEETLRVVAQLASSGWITWARGEAARHAASRLGQGLAMASHELRNPLNSIAAAAALLAQRLADSREDAAAVGIINRQALVMSRLVTDLFDAAGLEHRKLDLRLTPIDLRALVIETVATRRQQLERQGHTLALRLGEQPLCVDADPMRLGQILSNLIDNAIKYTARGGHIEVSLRRTATEVMVTVNDSGYGLRADQLVGIFEPFAQAERAERVGGGLGLGLPLARSLAELHGGSLHATSPGQGLGSSFVVTLPAGGRQSPGECLSGRSTASR
jgi:signal transduction histidine kinase